MQDMGARFEGEILLHLKQNCTFVFDGKHTLSLEEIPIYPEVYLCRLVLGKGTVLTSRKRRSQTLAEDTEFQFLFKPSISDHQLVPLSNDRSNILLANRLFDLRVRDDRERLAYAHFYYGICKVEKAGEALNIPATIDHVRLSRTATAEQRATVLGALWRFLDHRERKSLRVEFEERGLFQWTRHRAYVPAQLGDTLYDIELKIWQRSGHIAYSKTMPIYSSPALAGTPLPKLGKVPLPRYISRRERARLAVSKAIATLGRAAYGASTLLFVLASLVCVAFLFEALDFSLVRLALGQAASLVGIGTWKVPLLLLAGYCIAYFVFTTTLVLDIDTLRGTLHRWVPKIEGTSLDNLLYDLSRRQHRSERAYKPPLWKRLLWSGFLLLFWSLYLVAIFTTLDACLQDRAEPDTDRMFDVAVVLSEQALLYIPMVVYYAGRSFLDPEKLLILNWVVLGGFRLIIGLLVVRRIHRFWAVTASSKLAIKSEARGARA
jgi:hypothetical protein